MPQTHADFERKKQQAAEELLKMGRSAENKTERFASERNLNSININSLDADIILILGILLILMGESKDNLLILTLFYILI